MSTGAPDSSRWRLPELAGRSLVAGMLLVGVLNYLAVVIRPSWVTVVWWNVWNVAILAAAWAEDRRERAVVVAGGPQ